MDQKSTQDRKAIEIQGPLNLQAEILKHAAHGIISTTPEGLITSFNPAAERMLGYSAEEMVNLQSPSVFHDGMEVVQQAGILTLELGEPVEPGFDVFVIQARKNKPIEKEWTYIRKDGTRFPVLLTVTAVRDKEEKIAGYLGIAIDISERRKSEKLIKETSAQANQALVELGNQKFAMDQHVAFSVSDIHGCITHVNALFCELSQYTREEMLGKHHRMHNSGYHSKEFFRDLNESIYAGKVWHQEIRNRAKDGSFYWVDTTIVPFKNAQGEITEFMAIRTDITKRKQIEVELQAAKLAAENANHAKSEFLASMSHEIRTPMNGVLGLTQLLGETTLDEEQMDLVQTIKTSGEALMTILNDILDFSKIEAGKLTVESHWFNLRPTIDEIIELMAVQAQTKKINLNVTYRGELPQRIFSDQGRIRQVLLNLIGNALKFTSRGGVEVLVLQEEKTLRIEVEDTGVGIPQDKQPFMFQRFSQAHGSTARKFGGTGLGLAISKHLLNLLGGEIGFESQEGKGSRFWLSLPQEKEMVEATELFGMPVPSQVDTASNHEANQVLTLRLLELLGAETRLESEEGKKARSWLLLPQAEDGTIATDITGLPIQTEVDASWSAVVNKTPNLRILVVEDNLVNQKVVCGMLKKSGCHYDVTDNGPDAIEMAFQGHYDLILMDYEMPGMDGLETTQEIRRREGQTQLPEGSPPPHRTILALTANARGEDEKRCRESGMDGFLTKPLQLQALRQALREVGLANPQSNPVT